MRKLLRNSSVDFLYYKLVTSYDISGVVELNSNYVEILDNLKNKMTALLKIAVIDESKLKPKKLSFGYALGLYDSGVNINVLRAGFDSPALYNYKGVLDSRTRYKKGVNEE